jgi:hypothetical protein
MLEKEEAEKTRRMTKKTQDFQKQKQQLPLNNRHEFNFWDPDGLQLFPACLGGTNSFPGPDILQHLGEDLNRSSCLRAQQEQFRCSLDKQLQKQEEARAEAARIGKQPGELS